MGALMQSSVVVNMPQYGLACCSDDRTWSHSVMSRGRRHTQRDNGHDWPSLVTTILSPPAAGSAPHMGGTGDWDLKRGILSDQSSSGWSDNVVSTYLDNSISRCVDIYSRCSPVFTVCRCPPASAAGGFEEVV